MRTHPKRNQRKTAKKIDFLKKFVCFLEIFTQIYFQNNRLGHISCAALRRRVSVERFSCDLELSIFK